MYSFLSVGWGFISDIDIESERLRLIGGQRFTIWSVHRLISLRTYNGIVSYKPAPIQQSHNNQQQQQYSHNHYHQQHQQQPNGHSAGGVGDNNARMKHSMSYNTSLDCQYCNGVTDCEYCDIEFDDVLSLETITGGPDAYRPRLDSWYSATSRKSTYFSTADSLYQSIAERQSVNNLNQFNDDCDGLGGASGGPSNVQMFGPPSSIPALTTPVPDTWVTLKGDFVLVHAAYQSHLGSDCYFATESKLNDGIIWLVIIHAGVSRSQLLSFLLGLSSGTHIPTLPNDYIKIIPVTAFRIEPLNLNDSGHMTVDGENVEYGPIQGEIFPGIANVMVPSFNSLNSNHVNTPQ